MVHTPASLLSHCGRRLLIVAVAACLLATPAARAAGTVAGRYLPDVDYGRGSLVVGSDGNVYRALDAAKGKDPVAAKDATWQLAHAAFDMTLDVPGRFDSIEKAFAFIAGATISDTATVTVQLAPGTYQLTRSLVVGHSNGQRVTLKGGKDPGKYVVKNGDGNAIVVSSGLDIAMEGFVIDGNDSTANGVMIENHSSTVLRNLVIKDFRMGVSVGRGSHLEAEDVKITSKRGNAGVHAFAGSDCVLRTCSATLQANPRSTEITFGFAAWFSSTMECDDCTSTGWHDGFFCGNAGSLDLQRCSAIMNRVGASTYLDSSLRAVECTFEGNKTYGMNLHDGTASVVSCRFIDNRDIAIRSYGASMVDFRGRPCEISGSPVGVQSIASGVFVGVKPTIRGDGRLSDIYKYEMPDDAVFQFEK